MKNILLIIALVVGFSSLILTGLWIKNLYYPPTLPPRPTRVKNIPIVHSKDAIPEDLIVTLQEGATKIDADNIVFGLGLSYMYEGISKPTIDAKILFSSLRDTVKQAKNNSLVDDALYTDIAKNNIRIIFRLGTKRGDIYLFSITLGIIPKPGFSRYNSEIRIRAPVGQEDYYIERLKEHPMVKDAGRLGRINI